METVTYHKIWYGDLETMIREEFNVPSFSLLESLTEISNGSYQIFNANEYAEDSLEWFVENFGEGTLDYYLKQMFDKGLLPTDYPIFLDIWW